MSYGYFTAIFGKLCNEKQRFAFFSKYFMAYILLLNLILLPHISGHHYYITWNISDSCKSVQHGGEVGMMWITIKGDKGITKDIKLTEV
jgi:hypothetical protein